MTWLVRWQGYHRDYAGCAWWCYCQAPSAAAAMAGLRAELAADGWTGLRLAARAEEV